MSASGRLGPDSLAAIAALCRRGVWLAPDEDELARSLYPGDQDVVVLGDPATGVVALVREGPAAWLRLLVVHPDARRRGVGVSLLRAAEAERAGATTVTAGGDPLHPLFPGVLATDLALCATFEAAGYEPIGMVPSMEFDLRAPLPPDAGGWSVADQAATKAVKALGDAAGPAAGDALGRALAAESLIVVTDAGRVVGACAVDVDRAGVIGPVVLAAADIDPMAVQRSLLSGAIRLMRKRGHARGDLAAATTVRPAASLGAKIARVSARYSKALPTG